MNPDPQPMSETFSDTPSIQNEGEILEVVAPTNKTQRVIEDLENIPLASDVRLGVWTEEGHEDQLLLHDKPELVKRIKRLEQMNRSLHRLCTVDVLTHIPNRRAFEHALKVEWRRAQRGLRPLSLLMVDVDFFKSYNDQLGHPAGDICLKRVAQALSGALKRPGDLLSRYGGEEFAVLLPGTNRSGAVVVAESLCQAVRAQALPHPKSSVAPYVTVTVGVSEVRSDAGDGPLKALERADRALYRAKAQGRNGWCLDTSYDNASWSEDYEVPWPEKPTTTEEWIFENGESLDESL